MNYLKFSENPEFRAFRETISALIHLSHETGDAELRERIIKSITYFMHRYRDRKQAWKIRCIALEPERFILLRKMKFLPRLEFDKEMTCVMCGNTVISQSNNLYAPKCEKCGSKNAMFLKTHVEEVRSGKKRGDGMLGVRGPDRPGIGGNAHPEGNERGNHRIPTEKDREFAGCGLAIKE